MKRIVHHLVVVVLAACSFVSCFPEAEFSQTVTVAANFEYSEVDFDADSLFYKTDRGAGIGWGSIGFLHKVDTVNFNYFLFYKRR